MKFRSTLMLLIIALVVGGYIWFYEKKQASTDEQEQKGKLVFTVKADDIDRVELAGGKATIVCVKDKEGEWRLEQPLAYRADKSQMKSICSRFETLNSERVIKGSELDEKKREEFGLKKPRLTASFRARGTEGAISIGVDTPLGSGAYAQAPGAPDVYIINKSIYQVLNKEANDLRDKALIEFEPEGLSKVLIAHAGKRVELAQEGNYWRVAQPIQAPGDPDKIGAMLRKIKYLHVRDFTEDTPKDLAKYGLDSPAYEITLWDRKDQAARTLRIGKEAEKNVVYARRDGVDAVVTVNDDLLKELGRAPGEFRDEKVTRLAQGAVEEIRITKGDNALLLGKSGEKWEIREPEKKDADGTQVRNLLRAVTELKSTAFAIPKAGELDGYGLGKDAMQLTLKPKTGEAETILIGKKSGGKVYVKRSNAPDVLTVDAGFLKECVTDPARFVKKEVAPPPAPNPAKPLPGGMARTPGVVKAGPAAK
ncbi:MAG: DUF4340 domain-containing protein [Candidatus Aureabacteria bacterium]|nr:DUF4340 domain-containing protein [Candidatus Auribacterota bacterium]